MTTRAVFLDRDGVLTTAIERDGKPYAPSRAADLVIEPGAVEACARLRAAGFDLVVVTNQPEVSRGTLPAAELDAMNERLLTVLGVDEVEFCPHDDSDGCDCRKPQAGMLRRAAARRGIDLAASFMIGDRWRDVACAQEAGCTAIFLDRGWQERSPAPPFERVGSLDHAVRAVLAAGGLDPDPNEQE